VFSRPEDLIGCRKGGRGGMDMEKVFKIVVFQHTRRKDPGSCWTLPALLAAAGVEAAQELVESHRGILKGCDTFISSPVIRCQQALFVIMATLEIPYKEYDGIIIEPDLWTHYPDNWCMQDGSTPPVSKIWEGNKTAVEADGRRMFETLRRVAAEAIRKNRKMGLAISHRGPIDACLAHAKKNLGDHESFRHIQELGSNEGYMLSFQDRGIGASPELVRLKEIRTPVKAPAVSAGQAAQ
jgi:broad specificity phosphatase PhoE